MPQRQWLLFGPKSSAMRVEWQHIQVKSMRSGYMMNKKSHCPIRQILIFPSAVLYMQAFWLNANNFIDDRDNPPGASLHPTFLHIWVNFPKTGKMVKMWNFFYFFWSSAVTKLFDVFDFSQLSRYILKMFSF